MNVKRKSLPNSEHENSQSLTLSMESVGGKNDGINGMEKR